MPQWGAGGAVSDEEIQQPRVTGAGCARPSRTRGAGPCAVAVPSGRPVCRASPPQHPGQGRPCPRGRVTGFRAVCIREPRSPLRARRGFSFPVCSSCPEPPTALHLPSFSSKTPSRGLKSLCCPDALDLGNAPCARWALLLPACRPLCSSNSGAKPQSPRLLPSGTLRLAVPPPPRPLGLEAEEGGGRSVAEAIRAVLQDTDSAVPPSLLCPSVPPLSFRLSTSRSTAPSPSVCTASLHLSPGSPVRSAPHPVSPPR